MAQRCCVSAVFLFNNAINTYQYVIASQCSHWRGNPFPRHSKNAIARQGNLFDKLKFSGLLLKLWHCSARESSRCGRENSRRRTNLRRLFHGPNRSNISQIVFSVNHKVSPWYVFLYFAQIQGLHFVEYPKLIFREKCANL